MEMASRIFDVVLQNHEMLDSNCNWYQLAFLEVFYIKIHDAIINYGIKVLKELLLFN